MANVSGKTKIFRKDFDGKPSYSRAISSQKYENGQKGDWISIFETVQMPKDTILENKTTVEFEGFEAVYEGKDGVLKRKLVITKYDVVEQGEPSGFTALSDDDCPF